MFSSTSRGWCTMHSQVENRNLAKIMRKEILLAIIIGIIVGLGITFGVYTLRQKLFQNDTASMIEESRQGSTSPSPTPLTNLLIQQPEQDLLTREDSVQVVGRALPNSYIVILSNDTEYITTADKDGDFAQDVALVAGGNLLTIVATTPEGDQEQTVRNVIYSTIDLNAPTASGSAQIETPDEDA